MLLYQLSIRTIKSPKKLHDLFLSWWNSFTKTENRHQRYDKTRENLHKIKRPTSLCEAMRAATPTRRSNMDEKNPLSNFTERNQFLFVSKWFSGFLSKSFFPRLWQDSWRGLFGWTINLQLLSTSFQAAGCYHTGHTGQCSFGGPSTTSAGDLMALGNFVEFHLPRIGWVGTYILLTIDLRKPIFLFGVCKWAEWNIFFWEYYIFIYVYI